jgi:uroporphyrinogen decarboxylase
MRQAGRYLPEYRDVRAQAGDFLNLCYTPDLASEVTMQPIRRYDFDAAIIFSDILVVPHALGQNVWFVQGEGPKLDPIQSVENLNDFNKDQFLSHLTPVFEAVDKTRGALGNDKSLIGFSGAPWTLACYMINGQGSRDYANVRHFSMSKKEEFKKIIQLLIDSISIYLIEKVKAGADVIQIFDSWAGVLSTEEFYHYSVLPTKQIVTNIKKAFPNVPIIGFPRGAGLNYETYITETGIDAVSCDQSVPLNSMKDFQKYLCVQGNLDNMLLRHGGPAMINQAEKICQALSDKPFIFNLGHGVIKETKPDDVAKLVECVKNFKPKWINNAS